MQARRLRYDYARKGRAALRNDRKAPIMKVHDFAYQVSVRTMELLFELHRYTIPEELKKQVTSQILTEVDAILKKSS